MANKHRSTVTLFGDIDKDGEGAIYGDIDRDSKGGDMHVVVRKREGKPAYIRIEVDGETVINGYMADSRTQAAIVKDRRNFIKVKGSEDDR